MSVTSSHNSPASSLSLDAPVQQQEAARAAVAVPVSGGNLQTNNPGHEPMSLRRQRAGHRVQGYRRDLEPFFFSDPHTSQHVWNRNRVMPSQQPTGVTTTFPLKGTTDWEGQCSPKTCTRQRHVLAAPGCTVDALYMLQSGLTCPKTRTAMVQQQPWRPGPACPPFKLRAAASCETMRTQLSQAPAPQKNFVGETENIEMTRTQQAMAGAYASS
jgi:hypothetical protein|mmetsp:Transcript_85756/g.142773  ORF Transcript_85756/g.142773 Transcript_85756/m.142773 type:complete len:214 (+) Transcript_85756:809-1450(+)|eukprot:CAMPEP_0174379898 /NCGR_PEP_ID=MMETSP0811_2-20130205/122999_1 /TAXON_ID=73025 ORGANISM="Eutreptiella gymnastica-like, Strain CCMP1594" /NCGR_SAMPLE_ID=MMETSP0811_2 /ASSEMBLY_ACC=CAM_ASM_000667 /LENGTH=213 /DNA_ID=CAMNT_0015532565 /DNA_START=1644 /DNA_END=2285 /DNA_ORIENTATION=+